MVSYRHAVLFPCEHKGVAHLLDELSESDAVAALHPEHAAVIAHAGLGELEVTIAGRGALAELVGRPAGTAAIRGALLLIAAVETGFAQGLSNVGVRPRKKTLRRLADALPPRSTALLLVVQCGDRAVVRRSVRSATDHRFVAFDVASGLEPWLASKVDVDMRVEQSTAVARVARIAM